MEVLRAMVAASTNRMAVAVCDRCGDERGASWVAGSAIAGAGRLAAGRAAGARRRRRCSRPTSTCRRRATRRSGPRNDALADRRPALYG